MNLADALGRTAALQPDALAVVGPRADDAWTYGELNRRVSERAAELRRAGVARGHTVGLNVRSGRNYIVLTYALWRAGASVVPIAIELSPQERANICRTIGMDAVVTTERQQSALTQLALASGSVALDDGLRLLSLRTAPLHPVGFMECNPAFLRFSSGTTGSAKGVVLSHETVWQRIHAANQLLRIGPDDRVVWLLSMSHHFTVSIVSYLTFGATIVLCANHLGRTIVEAADRARATIIYGSPTHYGLLAHSGSEVGLGDLRLAISTATALERETAEDFERRFGRPLVEAYGIIEIGLPCINYPCPKRGSVGRPLPSYKLRLRDAGLGSRCQAIQVRGPGIIDAYYAPFRPRSSVLERGWFETGDLGYLDEQGYLFITGRSKELINCAGLKFFPREVEAVLGSHPAVTESRVFAAPDRTRGEVAHAKVVLEKHSPSSLSPAALMEFCANKLAAYKIPEEIAIVEELPRTASGKLIRRTSITSTKEVSP